MDSISAPSMPVAEESIFPIDGPPSSPFVTEVGARSRNTSKQFNELSCTGDAISADLNVVSEALSAGKGSLIDLSEDKENAGQIQKLITPVKTSTDEQRPPSSPPASTNVTKMSSPDRRRGSTDSDLMPPPTTRLTPKRSPLKTLHSPVNTPGTLNRGDSYERAKLTSQRPAYSLQKSPELQLHHESTGIDDTCFSNFSEIPDLTQWAKKNQSPTKQIEERDRIRTPGRDTARTPRTSRKRPSPSRSPSPTPRRLKTPGLNQDGTQTFLIDFTQQLENLPPSQTEPNLLQYLNGQRSPAKTTRLSLATPAKQNNILNLLDFELPPAPTPRSIPTITVRELETLKSSYLSQISSLKATLSGREAEVESLKRAVGDAERRVGEAQETLREEKSRREHVEQEKRDWEKRGTEVESVLRSVKEEVLKGDAEKEELVRRIEDSERRVDEAESRALKAEERFADALVARVEGDGDDDARGRMEEQVQHLVAAQIDAKIEAVSRELHAVYKEKHERKVATLKKSYEARSEKRCTELQARVAELEKTNDDLVAAKDATFSGPVPDATTFEQADDQLRAQMEQQKAHLARIQEELLTSRSQQEELVRALERERIEKGDLVAAVDEMLTLQADQGPTKAMSVVEDFRKSISRPPSALASGLKPPGESRIGRTAQSGRIPAPSKSRMLANIERMGRTFSHEG